MMLSPTNQSYLVSTRSRGEKNKAIRTPEYERWIELIPSPDHAHFVINNHGGSNFAYPIIFNLPDQGKPKSVVPPDKNRKSWRDKDYNLTGPFWKTFRNDYNLDVSFDHAYINAIAWLDNDTVLLGARAHGANNPGKSSRESTNIGVEPYWCQLYSLKKGTMSSNLKAFNAQSRTSPNGKCTPNNNMLTIALEQPINGGTDPLHSPDSDTPAVNNQTVSLPKKEEGQVFTGFCKTKKGESSVLTTGSSTIVHLLIPSTNISLPME